jgi:hypothetical protein
MRTPIAAILFGTCLALPATAAAGPTPASLTPIRAAAAREAEARGAMPTGLKWTGIGLLIGSAGPATLAAFSDCVRSDRACRNERRGAYIASGVLAGTGVALLGIANARRAASLPALEVGGGRAVLVQRLRF